MIFSIDKWTGIARVRSRLFRTVCRFGGRWQAVSCATRRSLKTKPPLRAVITSGRGGIRTHGTLLTYTHFPGVRLKPLGHPSNVRFSVAQRLEPGECDGQGEIRTLDTGFTGMPVFETGAFNHSATCPAASQTIGRGELVQPTISSMAGAKRRRSSRLAETIESGRPVALSK